MIKKNGKIVQLSIAALLLLAPVAVHAQKHQGGKAVPKLAAGYSYVACYFSGDQWNWGLTPDNGWYSMAGDWKTLNFTKIQVFVTATSQSDIEAACARTKAYYKYSGNFTAGYAATQSAGYNYIILSNGACLYPKGSSRNKLYLLEGFCCTLRRQWMVKKRFDGGSSFSVHISMRGRGV